MMKKTVTITGEQAAFLDRWPSINASGVLQEALDALKEKMEPPEAIPIEEFDRLRAEQGVVKDE